MTALEHAELVAEAHQWISDFGYDLPNACQLMRRLADVPAAFPSEKAVSQLSDTATALMGSTVDGLSRIEELAAENARLREALVEAEVGLRFAGANIDIPEGDFVPTPVLAYRAVRAALAPVDGEE